MEAEVPHFQGRASHLSFFPRSEWLLLETPDSEALFHVKAAQRVSNLWAANRTAQAFYEDVICQRSPAVFSLRCRLTAAQDAQSSAETGPYDAVLPAV